MSHFFFQFGLKALTALPGFITSSVHSVLFSLLAHPQLSIREHATKALSAILSRCEFEVRQSLHMYMMVCINYMLTRLEAAIFSLKEFEQEALDNKRFGQSLLMSILPLFILLHG